MMPNKKKSLYSGIWLAISIISRIMPHLPNMTPLPALSVLCCKQLSKLQSIALITLSFLISNFIIALFNHYQTFGWWSLSQITGLIVIYSLSKYISKKTEFSNSHQIITTFAMSIIYWAWLNTQTWISTNLYLHNINGFLTCQFMGLPFLRNMFIGDIIFLTLMLGLPNLINNLSKNKNTHLIT